MIFLPFVAAVLFALIQLGYYALLKQAGKIEDIPFFGVMLFRGLILAVALTAIAAISLHYLGSEAPAFGG